MKIDSPLYRLLNVASDIILLSLLWTATSLLIVTIGASTTALYYVATRECAYRDYFRAFKSNFIRSTLIWLIVLSFLLPILKFDLVWLKVFLLSEIVFALPYLFMLTAKVELSLLETFRLAFLISNKHIWTSILCLIMFIGILFAAMNYPLLLPICIGIYIFCSAKPLIKVLRTYRHDLQ